MKRAVTRNRNIQGGQPVIAGTRTPTSAIWAYWSQGYDEDGIQEAYPHLTIEQIVSAVLYEEQWWRRLERYVSSEPFVSGAIDGGFVGFVAGMAWVAGNQFGVGQTAWAVVFMVLSFVATALLLFRMANA